MNNSDLNITTGAIIDDGADATVNTGKKVATTGMTVISRNVPQVQPEIVVKKGIQTVGGILVVPCGDESPLEQEIPSEEKAVEPDDNFYRMEVALDLISAPSLSHMANLQNVLNNCFYAGIQTDSNGIRSVTYCQRYDNGSFSPKMKMMQADILKAHEYLTGYPQTKIPREILRTISNARDEYLNKFSGDPEECIRIQDIMNVLYTVLHALPVKHHNSTRYEKWDFYQRVKDIVKYLTSQSCISHKSYYPLMDCDIAYIADSLNMKKWDLLKKLDSYGLLYRPSSSMGYQTNVRIKYYDGSTETEWRYCLAKLDYIAGIDDHTNTDCSWNF